MKHLHVQSLKSIKKIRRNFSNSGLESCVTWLVIIQCPRKIALAVREKIKQFRSIINGSPEVIFCVDSPTFVELASTPQDWSHRMSKYLALATHLTPKYDRSPDRYKHQLDLLSKPIPIDESQPSSVQVSAVSKFFNNAIQEEVLSIPIVHTDGGCVTKAGSKRGSIGVYWGPASTFNLSQLATIGRSTNQRAEVILHWITNLL